MSPSLLGALTVLSLEGVHPSGNKSGKCFYRRHRHKSGKPPPWERKRARCEAERLKTLFGRFSLFILINYHYERSPLWRRMIVNAFAGFDYALLSLPFFRSLAGYAVFYGHVQHPGPAGSINHDVN